MKRKIQSEYDIKNDAFKCNISEITKLGSEGVLCLMSESTYAEKKGYTAPNNRITQVITKTAFIMGD